MLAALGYPMPQAHKRPGTSDKQYVTEAEKCERRGALVKHLSSGCHKSLADGITFGEECHVTFVVL